MIIDNNSNIRPFWKRTFALRMRYRYVCILSFGIKSTYSVDITNVGEYSAKKRPIEYFFNFIL